MRDIDNHPGGGSVQEDSGRSGDSAVSRMLGAPYVSHPPRSVQPLLAAVTVLGAPAVQLLVFLIGFFGVFAHLTYITCDRVVILSWVSRVRSVHGTVTEVRLTGTHVNNGPALKRYAFSYRDRAGAPHTAWQLLSGESFKAGDSVKVEYAEACPGIARIAGTMADVSAIVVILVGLFVLLLMVSLASALFAGVRAVILLRKGEAAVGTLGSSSLRRLSGRADSFGRATYDRHLVYDFTVPDGSQHKVKATTRAGTAHQNNAEAELADTIRGRVLVMYDPASPDKEVTDYQLPGRPRFDRPGTVYSGKPWTLMGYLIVPVLVVGVHILWTLQ